MRSTFRHLRWVLALALLFVPTLGARTRTAPAGGDALILLSKEAEPFRQCERAARDRLEREGWIVRTALHDPKSSLPGGMIIAVGTEAAKAAAARPAEPANRTVFCMVADPDGAGLEASARLTGVSAEVSIQEQVQLIAEAMPKAKRIGIVHASGSERGQAWVQALRDACGDRFEVDAEGATDKQGTGPAVERLLASRADIIWTMPDSTIYDANTIKSLLQATLRAGVPVFGFSTPTVRAGALLGVGIDPASQGDQAAELVMASINKAPPVRTPRYEIGVNLVVAQRLGITLPKGLVGRARNVFKGEEGK